MTGHLLVVDDSPTVRKLVEISLRATPYSADFVSSGAEAIAFAKRAVPDLVLLDFVLPDMRGTEVCARFARDPRLAGTRVVLMTAKGENVRDLFAGYPFVVGYLAKPFTPACVVDTIGRSLAQRGPAPPRRRDGAFTSEQKELAARTILTRLRMDLAPTVIEDLLESLLPIYRRALATDDARAAVDVDTAPGFHGRLERWPLADIVMLFASSARTGELTLKIGERTIIAFLRRGEVVLITTTDPVDYLKGGTLDLRGVPADAVERALAEQRSSGKPAYLSLAAAGVLPESDLTAVLHARSRRLLHDTLEARAGAFRWRDLDTLPDYVDAYGRHVSLHRQRDTLHFGPPASNPPPASSLSQLTLERLRAQHSDGSAAEPLPEAQTVFARTQGFSSRVVQFTIDSFERRVLAMIDGELSLQAISERTGLGLRDVARVASRLAVVGLVFPKPSASPSRTRSGPVMILEPDVEGFQRPLEKLLRDRAEPIDLLDLTGERDVVAAARRERPRLIILNVDVADHDAHDTARAIRESRELDDLRLVAVLERAGAERASSLGAAGFSTVLVKPVLYGDLERLLA